MTELNDAALLRRYAEDRSEEAFAEIVRRHLDLVYSAALRRLGGDTHRARDVAQIVFAALARKAAALSRRPLLASWLHVSAHHAAAEVVRGEQRRRAREEEAHIMQDDSPQPNLKIVWERMLPELDDAIRELKETDREAVLLRYFERRGFAEIGAALRLNEEAARKRVDRALDKLRGALGRRGITSSSAALAVMLEQQAIVAAPEGLAIAVSASASSQLIVATGTGAAAITTALKFLALGNLAIVSTMKVSTLVLIGSLAANAALIVTYATRSQPAGSSLSTMPAAATSSTAAATKKNGDTSGGVTANPIRAATPGMTAAQARLPAGWAHSAKEWDEFLGGDLHDLVARLRAAGFPYIAIVSILDGRLDNQFAPRLAKLLPTGKDVDYLKPHGMGDRKTVIEVHELLTEKNRLIAELLGQTQQYDETRIAQRNQYGDLPQEKLDRLQAITSDYGNLQSKIYVDANGVMLPEDREKLALLEKEMRADVAQILTPQELEEYDLRSSRTANQLRSQLTILNPTEQEYRALVKLQLDFDRRQSAASGTPSVSSLASGQQLQAQIQAALGPERYAAYQQATDPGSQQLNRLVLRLDLPISAAQQVTNVQKDVQQRATTLVQQADLAPDQRSAQLAALAAEATKKISSALGGQRGFDAYKQYGGAWLQSLGSRPATP